MRVLAKTGIQVAMLLGLLAPVMATCAQIKEMRVWPQPDTTRVVFDLSGPIEYKVFMLDNPPRLVLDAQDSQVVMPTPRFNWSKTPIKSVRSSPQSGGHVRIVFDLRQAIQTDSFTLKPNGPYGHRLVLDLNTLGAAGVPSPTPSIPLPPIMSSTMSSKPSAPPAMPLATSVPRPRQRDFIVAIDAGHGGEDPGAIGPKGTREKDVVLQMAKELHAQMSKQKGLKPVLVRGGDYYIPLRTRIVKARQAQADLFISIHADAFKRAHAKGASVFTLSSRGASSEAARWLAESENRADLIGGVSLNDKDDVLAKVLLDLSQTVSSESSFTVGNLVLRKLGRVTDLHGRQVQQAGFAVLKSPDIPSILIETEFISNPQSEQKLRSKAYQRELAQAVLAGVNEYLKTKAHQYQDLPVAKTASN
ncbi:MAG: N-acetylmuramoyl-L-alanine amidase [Gammaproteobacteria bacterium]